VQDTREILAAAGRYGFGYAPRAVMAIPIGAVYRAAYFLPLLTNSIVYFLP